MQILRESKKKYLENGELRNVHLFLDEVSHLGQDWCLLDKLAEDPTNSIWLSSNPEYYYENIQRIKLVNFKNIRLDLVLRNTKLINNLCNDIRRYLLSYSKVARIAIAEDYRTKEASVYQGIFDDERHQLSTSGHFVEGFPPHLVILEQCRCVFKSICDLSQCQCLLKRCEAALRHCLATMFDLDSKFSLSEMVKMLDEPIHISVTRPDWPGSMYRAIIEILKNNNVLYAMLNGSIEDTSFSSKFKAEIRPKLLSNCRVFIISDEMVLGKEFTNLIYFNIAGRDTEINPYTKDLKGSIMLSNVSRAKCKLIVINLTGKECNRHWVTIARNGNIPPNYHPNQYNAHSHWIFYHREIISKFLLIDTIKKGSILLLPLPSQKHFDKKHAMQQLLEGLVDERMRYFREQGNDAILKHKGIEKYRSALKLFVNGLVICQRRLTGDYPWNIFDPLNTFGEHDEANKYLISIKEEEFKLLLNSGICLIHMNLIKRAHLLFQFLTKNYPKSDNAIFYHAKCLYEMGDYMQCIECLHKCLQLNEYKESATKLLGRAQRKLKDHDSKISSDDLTKVERECHRFLVHENERAMSNKRQYNTLNEIMQPNNQDSDISSVISLNVKIEIINGILKPISGFNEEWKLKNEFGFEYEDLHNL